MKLIHSLSSVAIIVAVMVSCGPAEASELVWGQNIGPVSALVAGADTAEGLTVRAEPSQTSRALSHVQVGAKIEGRNVFKNGWMKIESAKNPGWVPIVLLQPSAFERTLSKAVGAKSCMAIRDAPTKAAKKVDCAKAGVVLKFSGIMTADNWLELADNAGWVQARNGLKDKRLVSKDQPSSAAGAKVVEKTVDRKKSRVRSSAQTNQQPRKAVQTTKRSASADEAVEDKPINTGLGSTERMLEEAWHEADKALLPGTWANY